MSQAIDNFMMYGPTQDLWIECHEDKILLRTAYMTVGTYDNWKGGLCAGAKSVSSCVRFDCNSKRTWTN